MFAQYLWTLALKFLYIYIYIIIVIIIIIIIISNLSNDRSKTIPPHSAI